MSPSSACAAGDGVVRVPAAIAKEASQEAALYSTYIRTRVRRGHARRALPVLLLAPPVPFLVFGVPYSHFGFDHRCKLYLA
jgi:hypothetical protein